MNIASFERAPTTKPRYVPPTGDEPLDDNERAFIRALVPIIAAKIRAELEAERAAECHTERAEPAGSL